MKNLAIALHPPILLFLLSLFAGLIIHPIFYLGSLIFIGDIRGRYKDYQVLKRKPRKYFRYDILVLFGRSWCGRQVVIASWPPAEEFYTLQGYKWYHVFPDEFFTTNTPLLKKKFWVNLITGHS